MKIEKRRGKGIKREEGVRSKMKRKSQEEEEEREGNNYCL